MDNFGLPAMASKYNLGVPAAAHTMPDTPLTAVAGPGEVDHDMSKPWSPHSPLFWFGALAAATFGLMAVSTSVRVGAASASVSLGKK